MSKITVVGDIHGNMDCWVEAVYTHPDSAIVLQVGDFGFGFSETKEFPQYYNYSERPSNGKILLGNHDNPEAIYKYPDVVLGDYGYIPELDLGYVRGAFSRDKATRTEGVSWWAGEELTYPKMEEAINFLESKNPSIIVAHDAPRRAYPCLLNPNQVYSPNLTAEGLDSLFEIVRPKVWVHGHHHNKKTYKIGDTVFLSLEINEVHTFETDWYV